jgi:GxxExxY protein
MHGDDEKNHEEREENEGHEDRAAGSDPLRYVRVASPLSAAEESTMRRVIGCAIDVHRRLGPGFLESIYRRAMAVELEHQGLAFELERAITIDYRGTEVGEHRIDLVVERLVVVALKAVAGIDPVHRAQVIAYLRSTRLRAGLLLNFRVARMKDGITRIVL